jgi:WD40 repeat protein
MRAFYPVFWSLLLLPHLLRAQPSSVPCYANYRNKGLDYMSRKDYGEAMSQFVAALATCPDVPPDNDLVRQIAEAKRNWASDLQASVTEAKNAYKEAVIAREIAENAKTAESEARKTAEENAKKALHRGIRAESFRLALLADMARQQSQKTDAMLLSWMGLQLSDTVQAYVKQSFWEAVRDSFTTAIFTNTEPIVSVVALPGAQHLLIETAGNGYFILNRGAPASVVQLPKQLQHIIPSPAGNYLAAWGNNSKVLIINLDGKTEATLSGHLEAIRAVAFSPGGDIVLTCARDNSAKLWDLKGREIKTLSGHTGNVQSGAFSPDGKFILTRSSDGSVRIWDAVGNLINTLRDSDNFIVHGFISAKNAVFTQLSNKTVKIWNENGSLVEWDATKQAAVHLLQSSENANFMAAISGKKDVIVWTSNGQLAATLPHSLDVVGFAFSKDENALLSWTTDNIIRRWNFNGKMLQEFKGHRKTILSADYNSSLNILLTTAMDGTSKLWDENGNLLCGWETGSQNPAPAQFAPSGNQIWTIGEGGKSMSVTPLPQGIYDGLDRETLLKSSLVNALRRNHNIQFLESLEGVK